MDKVENQSNEEVVVQLQQQFDELIFETLFQRFQPLVYKYYKLYRAGYYELDDYMQEARIVMLKAIEQYDVNSAYFASYFKLIYKNHIFNLGRYESAQKRAGNAKCVAWDVVAETSNTDEKEKGVEAVPDVYLTRPDEVAIVHDQAERYFACLSSLEQKVLASYLDGRTIEKIAAMLGETTSRCHNALDRCRQKLRLMNRKE